MLVFIHLFSGSQVSIAAALVSSVDVRLVHEDELLQQEPSEESECQLILAKTDSQQRILRHQAAQASVEMFNTVIRYCVPNLATKDKSGNTPLHVAAHVIYLFFK